jgi:hypothetical protein
MKTHTLTLLQDSPGAGGGGGGSSADAELGKYTTATGTSSSSSGTNSCCYSSCYGAILDQAMQWQCELEGVRDELHWLQVQNCQLLDALCMAGADLGQQQQTVMMMASAVGEQPAGAAADDAADADDGFLVPETHGRGC